MKKCLFVISLLVSSLGSASDWQLGYFDTKKGSLFVDQASIVDVGAREMKLWTIFAPRISDSLPAEGYSYVRVLRQIDCKKHLSSRLQATYYDKNGQPHEADISQTKHKIDIAPDSEDDFLWKYACAADERKGLGHSAGDISQFLADQVRMTKENMLRNGVR